MNMSLRIYTTVAHLIKLQKTSTNGPVKEMFCIILCLDDVSSDTNNSVDVTSPIQIPVCEGEQILQCLVQFEWEYMDHWEIVEIIVVTYCNTVSSSQDTNNLVVTTPPIVDTNMLSKLIKQFFIQFECEY